MQKTHELKTLPEYFQAVKNGHKTFEIRKNDRNFKVGDFLILKEWSHKAGYTGESIEVVISYIFEGDWYGLDGEYCILAIKKTEVEIQLLELINDIADWFKHDEFKANQVWSASYIKRLVKVYELLYGKKETN